MQNALAVYTSKPSLKGRRLAEIAQQAGVQIRFLALGGYIPSNADEIQDKALTAGNGGARLVVGAFESDSKTLAEFDGLIQCADQLAIAAILKGAKLPWCELYTCKFSYEDAVKKKPKDKPKLDGSVPKNQLPRLKAAKTRYIIYNQSRRKTAGQLMTRLADLIAGATDGIVADYQHP